MSTESELNAALQALQNLSNEELQRLIDDESVFDNYVQNLPQVKKWETDKEVLMASNKSLAEFNLSYEPKLREGKAVLMELYEKARALTDEMETKRAQLESLSSRTSLDTTYALLQASSAEADEESEALAEKFVAGELEQDAFINKFIALRTTAHLRRLKSEKMGEILASQRNPIRPSFNAVPYPTNPQSMPMPGMM